MCGERWGARRLWLPWSLRGGKPHPVWHRWSHELQGGRCHTGRGWHCCLRSSHSPCTVGPPRTGSSWDRAGVRSAPQRPPSGGREGNGVCCLSLESPSDRSTAVWAPRDGAAADDGPSLHHPRNTVRILHNQTQASLEAILHLLVSADEDDVSSERCQLSETFLNWAEGRVREPYLNPSGGFRASAVCLISTISEARRGERPSSSRTGRGAPGFQRDSLSSRHCTVWGWLWDRFGRHSLHPQLPPFGSERTGRRTAALGP